MLGGDDASTAAVYACGPPPMLDAVGAMCSDRGVACELAMESPMACGYGACFGCAVPKPGGGYMRLCVDGPVVRGARDQRPQGSEPAGRTVEAVPMVDFCGIELAHPVINASGTFDAIAARRVYGDALLEDFPFSAFVSKTITPEPRVGQRAAADLGDPGGDDQLDRAAEQGAGGLPGRGSAATRRAAGAADRLGDGDRATRSSRGWSEA